MVNEAVLVPGDPEGLIAATVRRGEHEAPVWIQTRWEGGEYAPYVIQNGCGHCAVAMALRLSGVPDIDPYLEYQNDRRLFGAPNEAAGEGHWLDPQGVAASLRSFSVGAEVFGIPAGGQAAATAHILSALRNGSMVVFLSFPLTEDNPFSTGAHYVLLVGIDGRGQVQVANSSLRGRTPTPGVQTVLPEALTAALLPEGGNPTEGVFWGQADYSKRQGYIIVGERYV